MGAIGVLLLLGAMTGATPALASATNAEFGEGAGFRVLAANEKVRLFTSNERGGVFVGRSCDQGATNELAGKVLTNGSKGFSLSLTKAFGQITGSEPCEGGVTVKASGLPWTLTSKGTSHGVLMLLKGSPMVTFTQRFPDGSTCVLQAKTLRVVFAELGPSPLPFSVFSQANDMLKLNKAESAGVSCQKKVALIALFHGLVEHAGAILVKEI